MVLSFLQSNFSPNTRSLLPIKAGETSQAFSFIANGNEFVIRAHSDKFSFEKDIYAYAHFHVHNIPIPKPLLLGEMDAKHFCLITEKAKGKTIDHFEAGEIGRFLPQLIHTFEAIHGLDITDTIGFGDWNPDGNGTEISWQMYLAKSIEDLNITVSDSIIEKSLGRYRQLIEYCPNARHLVHGDFSFSNVLADDEKITGVIDWELSKYGDFLYDLAYLDIFAPDTASVFFKHYRDKNLVGPNFRERVLCYKLHCIFGGLTFFSNSNHRTLYNWFKEKLLGLLE